MGSGSHAMPLVKCSASTCQQDVCSLAPSLPVSFFPQAEKALPMIKKENFRYKRQKATENSVKTEKKRRKVQCLCLTSQNNSKVIREKGRGRQTHTFHSIFFFFWQPKSFEIWTLLSNTYIFLSTQLSHIFPNTAMMPKSNLGLFAIPKLLLGT